MNRRVHLFALLFCVPACGEDEPAVSPSTNLDGGAGSGGATSGNGGAANGGAAGSGGTRAVSCAGTWGESARELMRGDPGVQIQSPTLSPDELELFYSTVDDVNGVHFRRSVRASKTDVFSMGPPLPELDAACSDAAADRHTDLSSDGLRAYIICTADPPPLSGPLRVARRSTLGGSFTLDASSFGTVGSSISISKDELVAYSRTFTWPGPPLTYSRSDRSSSFAAGIPVPGLEAANFTTPEPSPDGLSLYGNLDSSIFVATRAAPNGPFGAPALSIEHALSEVIGAPELSQDCRSLYYIGVDQTVSPDVYSLRVRTR